MRSSWDGRYMPHRWHGTFAFPPCPLLAADSQFWQIMSPPASNSSSIPPHFMQLAMPSVRARSIYWFAARADSPKKSCSIWNTNKPVIRCLNWLKTDISLPFSKKSRIEMPNQAKMIITVPNLIKEAIKALFLKKSAINAHFCANRDYKWTFSCVVANVYKQ